jgi:hypothetical protein
MDAEARSNRRRFLRQIGITLGVAAGAALYPAIAHAATNCCPAGSSRCTGLPNCPSGQQYFFCECGPGLDYCICHSGTTCYNGPCQPPPYSQGR